MNIKQTIRNMAAGGFLLLALLVAPLVLPSPVVEAVQCGGVETSIISCTETGDGKNGDVKGTGIWGVLKIVIDILIGGVAVLALAGIVYGAVLYTSAGGNAEQVKKAMAVFTNVVIGVVAFAGMWVLLNFLIPGGAFSGL